MTGEPHDDAWGEGRPDPIEAFTGDRASAARLRAGLARIATDRPGTGIASLANDVLAGRRHVRELVDDAEFAQVITQGVEDYRRHLDSMTPTERAEMVRAARESQSHVGQGVPESAPDAAEHPRGADHTEILPKRRADR